MGPRGVVLILAILAGVLAAWAAQRHLQALATDLQEQGRQETRTVVVAAEDLAPGTRLQWEHLAVRQIPVQWLPADILEPDDFPVIEQATLQHPVRRGDPLPWGYLVAPPERFSTQLAPGRRAVTIPVDDINSLAGLLQPGDHIDLYVSFQHRGERVTAPLLQDMKVLATGRRHDGQGLAPDGRFATVTLEASPPEALRLIAARQQGTISAMLRQGGDTGQEAPAMPGSLAQWLGLEQPGPEPIRGRRAVPVVFGDRHPAAIPRLDGSDEWQASGGGPGVETATAGGLGGATLPNEMPLPARSGAGAWRFEEREP